jgi:hypothetical protein
VNITPINTKLNDLFRVALGIQFHQTDTRSIQQALT